MHQQYRLQGGQPRHRCSHSRTNSSCCNVGCLPRSQAACCAQRWKATATAAPGACGLADRATSAVDTLSPKSRADGQRPRMTASCGADRRKSMSIAYQRNLKTLLLICCSAAAVHLTFSQSVCLRSSLLTLIGPQSGMGLSSGSHNSCTFLLAKIDTTRGGWL